MSKKFWIFLMLFIIVGLLSFLFVSSENLTLDNFFPKKITSLLEDKLDRLAESDIVSELEAKKQDFIKRTGDYTDEKIKDKLFVTGVGHERRYQLGFVSFENDQVDVQGWLFNYKEDNGNLVLEVGFDRDGGGDRIIKELVIPINFYKEHEGSTFGLGFWNWDAWQMANTGTNFLGRESDISIIKDRLEPFDDKPMIFSLSQDFIPTPAGENIVGKETLEDIESLFDSNSSAVNLLLSEISKNGEVFEIGSTEGADSNSLILAGVQACFE